MEINHKIVVNQELGQSYFYWELNGKRIFLARQIMSSLDYKGGNKTLYSYELIDGEDIVKFNKKTDNELFRELTHLNLLGHRAGEALFLTESGFWKLVIQSRKKVGIDTRNWLATQVLPSIRETGRYDVDGVRANPMKHLFPFTETSVQKTVSKTTNHLISIGDKNYSEIWNTVHQLVVGLNASQIKELYKSKESAKEVLRKHLPHLEVTETIVMDLWNNGIGLETIIESKIHKTMPPAIESLYKLGFSLEDLSKSKALIASKKTN